MGAQGEPGTPSAPSVPAHMAMKEKFNIQTQLEHLQMKYVGTGHADTTKQ